MNKVLLPSHYWYFLKVLTPEEQKKLSQSIKRGTFKKGDIIIKENEYGDILYYLESGICKTKKRVELGKKEIPGKDIKIFLTSQAI